MSECTYHWWEGETKHECDGPPRHYGPHICPCGERLVVEDYLPTPATNGHRPVPATPEQQDALVLSLLAAGPANSATDLWNRLIGTTGADDPSRPPPAFSHTIRRLEQAGAIRREGNHPRITLIELVR